MNHHGRCTRLTLGATALASVLAFAACGSGSGTTGNSGPAPSAAGQSTGQGAGSAAGQGSSRFGGQGGRGFPGVSGLVADVTASTAQVQSATAQTAVTWTKSTVFTAQVASSASKLRVGDCVSARPERPVTGTPAPTATGPTGQTSDSTVAAATVEIFPRTGGSCAADLAGGLGGAGAFGSRTGAPRPTGTGGPSATGRGGGSQGGPNAFGAQARGAVGTVTALGSGTFTVEPIDRRATGSATTTAPSPVTVTYAASTAFTTLAKSGASAVKVGVCMTAVGKTDDTGAVTANTVQVSQPVDGSCTSGFRGAGGFGRPGATTTGTGNA